MQRWWIIITFIWVNFQLLAQEIGLEIGPNVQHLTPRVSEHQTFTADSTHYFITSYFDNASIQNRFFIHSKSLTNAETFSGEVLTDRGHFHDLNSIVGILPFKNKVYAFKSRLSAEESSHLFTAHTIHSNGEMNSEGIELMEFSIKKILQDGEMFVATSHNQKHLVVLGLPHVKRGSNYIGIVSVFDTNFREVRKMSIDLGDIRNNEVQLKISNDASVYISVFSSREKIGTNLAIFHIDKNQNEEIKTWRIPLINNERIRAYITEVLPNNDFLAVGTIEDYQTFSVGEIRTSKLFTYRISEGEEHMIVDSIIPPTKDLKFRKVLVGDSTIYICGEEITEEQYIPTMPTSGIIMRNIHGNECIFALDIEGNRLFETRLEQHYETLSYQEMYSAGFHLKGDNLIAIYHDEAMYWGVEAHLNRTIPVFVLISPEGNFERIEPIIDDIFTRPGFNLLPILGAMDNTTMTTFIRSADETKMIQILNLSE